LKYLLTSLLIACSIYFVSCEKEVKIDLKNGELKLVVDGQIETNGYPFVVLTKSIGYFSKVDFKTLQNTFVHNADITVTDGTTTIKLKEYAVDTGANGSSLFSFYSIDTSDATSLSFRGQAEKYYSIKIVVDGKTYTSTTKIPSVKGVDSIWFSQPGKVDNTPTAVVMYARYSDPDSLGNYVRYFTKRNSELFLTAFSSTFNDEIVNGTTLDSLMLTAGYNRTKEPNFDSLGFFFVGDTVSLKWSAIDKASYQFFSTLEYATGAVGNPFASPVNVTSNIQGNALGAWVGYGSQITTRVVPKK